MSGVIRKENKGDFEVLEKAAEQIKDQLKYDEKFPDLRDRLLLNSSNISQQYYLEPYQSECGYMLEHKGFVPIPASITEQYGKVTCASFMGLIPEINRAWITVDNKLFLWDYLNPNDYLQYDGLTEVIISVTLTTPRPGIFTDIVKYLLVIATPVEIILLAITWNSDNKQIKLQHTKYAIPSDEVTMLKIISTQNGRIFMGGNDGNLYELIYENNQDSWVTYLGIGETYKCRKVNHSSWNLVNIIPPLLKGIIGWDDTLCDLVVDDIRSLLYTITQKGDISMFYLGGDHSETTSSLQKNQTITPLCHSFNLFNQIKSYFDNLSNNLSLDSQYYDPINNQITIIGAHVISQLESKSLHLLIVLSSGIRIFISATDEMGFISSNISQPPTVLRIQGIRGVPAVNVLTQPSTHTKQSIQTNNTNSNNNNTTQQSTNFTYQGYSHMTSYNPNLKFRSSYYSHGVFLTNYHLNQSLQSDPNPQDILLGLVDDYREKNITTTLNPLDSTTTNSSSSFTTSPLSSSSSSSSSSNLLKEAVNVLQLSQYRNSHASSASSSSSSSTLGAAAFDSYSTNNRIYDIKETCPQLYDNYLSRLRVLASTSKTPSDISATRSNLETISSTDPIYATSPPGYTQSLSYAGRERRIGISSRDYSNISQLNEYTWQHLSIPSLSTQRQFLCLTLSGIHVLNKLRPIDYLVKLISLKNLSSDLLMESSYFKSYSHLQSGAMCVGISCGLPMDAGNNQEGIELYNQRSSYITSSDTIKRRAILILLQLGGTPSYRRGGFASTNWTTSTSTTLAGSMDFIPSLCYQSILLFSSRLLRPIWYQPVVSYTLIIPHGIISSTTSSLFTTKTNKSMSHLLSSSEIEMYRIPLIRLLGILREYFSASVRSVPIVQQQATKYSSGSNGIKETGSGKMNLLMNVMEKTKRVYENETISSELEAKKYEEYNYHLLYRLLSRTHQLLSLLEILQQIEREFIQISGKGVSIEWNKLENISFSKLITTTKGHELIRFIINDLLKQLSNTANAAASSSSSSLSSSSYPSSSSTTRRESKLPSDAPTSSYSSFSTAPLPFVEDTIEYLSNNCYLWFSPGDKYLYEANKLYLHAQSLMELFPHEHTSSNPDNEVMKTLQLTCSIYLKSSKYWKSFSDVSNISITSPSSSSTASSSSTSGASSSSSTTSSVDQKSCLLWDISSKLISLGGEKVIASIIDICLSTSENFDTKHFYLHSSTTSSSSSLGHSSSASTSASAAASSSSGLNDTHPSFNNENMNQWEKNLYNNYEILTEEEKKLARQSCYNCFLHYIQTIFHTTMNPIGNGYLNIPKYPGTDSLTQQSQQQTQQRQRQQEEDIYDSYLMKVNTFSSAIKYALSKSDDQEYHLHIYSYLYQLDKGILITLESKHIENYLREHDNTLLYNHYTYHGRHGHAAYLMDLLAHSDEEIDINQRISYLTRAINSASQAALSPPPSDLQGLNQEIITHYSLDKLEDLKEKLQIAELQRNIFHLLNDEFSLISKDHKLQSSSSSSSATAASSTTPSLESERQFKLLADNLHKLQYSLFAISDLFNNITEPYKLWEYSLIIIYLCKYDDVNLIHKLWKSIIFRIIPKVANNPEIQEYLDNYRRKSNIVIDKRRQKNTFPFEATNNWIHELEEKIIDLGSRFRSGNPLNGSVESSVTMVGMSGKNCFPLLVLIEELEEITSLSFLDNSTSFHRGWVYRCLLKTGISHGELLEGYMEIFRKWNGKKAGKLLQLLESIGVLALNWTRIASGYSTPHSIEVQEFQLCAKSGKFRNWMEKLLQQLSTLSGHVLTPQERKQLHEAQINIKEAETKVISLLLV